MNAADSILRLKTVDRVRADQRQWVADTREAAASGRPFAICSSDEFEEIFSLFDVPVLVINYWNFVIVSQGKAAHFSQVLEKAGYPGPHFLSLGLASSLEPEQAPWGGLPKPIILLGSTRSDYEMRMGELWARALDCEFYPLDFNMQSAASKPLPDDWWRRTETDWEAMVDPERLELRIAQNYELIRHLECRLGRSFDNRAFVRSAELENEQMRYWQRAHDLIAAAPRCPVSLRDQLAMYQPMWKRGTEYGLEMFRLYFEEVQARVADGLAGYPVERKRLLYWSMLEDPPFHAWLRDRYGAVFVGNNYGPIPGFYIRQFDPAEPMRAMAGRHLFLFGQSPELMIAEARAHRVDGIVMTAPNSDRHPTRFRQAAVAAGIPLLEVPDTQLSDRNQALLTQFMESALATEPLLA